VDSYVPKLTSRRIEELRRWHEDASAELHRLGAHDVEYLGLRLHVSEHFFPPTPTSDLLGREVITHVRPGQRVLDMGCGAGANAERNGVAARVRRSESDVFSDVDGDFDVGQDPPRVR
jgi:methylase of polypeptide subunit release factors